MLCDNANYTYWLRLLGAKVLLYSNVFYLLFHTGVLNKQS